MSPLAALVQARKAHLSGRTGEAIELVQRFLRRDPNHPEANHSMSVLLAHTGQHQRAVYFAQKAVAADPGVPDYRISLAAMLDMIGQRAPALAAAAEAERLGGASALIELVPLYWGMGELDAALRVAESAMRLDPRAARGPLAHVLVHTGQVDAAVSLLRTELGRDPEAPDVLMPLVQALNYCADVDPREHFELHQRLGRTFAPFSRPARPRPVPVPDQRLRVGIISPDLYTQSVSYFAEPLIEHLDRRQFEVFCYSTAPKSDATTERLRRKSDHWRDLSAAEHPATVAGLDADALDILIELAGITTGHVLPVMAARPAPVQVSAIGYPNTTGLAQIDYRVVDEITDPPSSLATESLVRLPGCFLCYRPPEEAPAPGEQPHDTLTFGSFNIAQKISSPTIETWTRLVNAVPGSRLILKSSQFATDSVRARFASRFHAAGLDPSRLDLLPAITSKTDHLALYNRIDIALDPFPYNGTTTTCEALYMGVPVVTLEGRVHAARVGSSLLRAAGLDDLVAHSLDEYISTAASLATDASRRTMLRSELRARVLSSPLCDGKAYGVRFGSALRQMWRDQCARR